MLKSKLELAQSEHSRVNWWTPILLLPCGEITVGPGLSATPSPLCPCYVYSVMYTHTLIPIRPALIIVL